MTIDELYSEGDSGSDAGSEDCDTEVISSSPLNPIGDDNTSDFETTSDLQSSFAGTIYPIFYNTSSFGENIYPDNMDLEMPRHAKTVEDIIVSPSEIEKPTRRAALPRLFCKQDPEFPQDAYHRKPDKNGGGGAMLVDDPADDEGTSYSLRIRAPI